MSMTLKTLLIAIRDKPKYDRGICGQPAMTYLSVRAFNIVRKLMVQWPKYSGHYDYPVPAITEGASPKAEFHDSLHELWDRNTEYGALRWELLDWLIEQPEAKVLLYKMRSPDDKARPVFNIKE